MKKRWMATLLASAFIVSLAGCSGRTEESTDESRPIQMQEDTENGNESQKIYGKVLLTSKKIMYIIETICFS